MKKYPVYLVLLPLFFVLYYNNQLFGFLLFSDSVLIFAITLTMAAAGYGLTYLFTRYRFRAAVTSFFILLLVLYFGPYHDFIKSVIHNPAISSYKVVLPVTVIVLVTAMWYLFKRTIALAKFSNYLNVLFLVLCTVELARIAININRVRYDHNLMYPGKPICNSYRASNLPDSAKPDIYLLVFDEYANNSTLKKFWNFDNSGITNYLQQQGFYIATNSTANYDFTPFSISSLLNMNYLDKKNGNRGDIAINRLKSAKSMSDNETICILEKEHYQIRFFAPFVNKIDDIGITQHYKYFSTNYIYTLTLPGRFKRDIAWNFRIKKTDQSAIEMLLNNQFQKAKADVVRAIDAIRLTTDSSANRKPRFVYGHFMMAHRPHYFDSAGNQLPVFSEESNLFNTYIQQIQYANKVIKQLTDHIKRTNKKNTIIIIEGDHGYRRLPAGNSALHHSNFCSIYFPGSNYSSLPDNISLVNEFRIVFNNFFQQKLPLLKDSTIFVPLER